MRTKHQPKRAPLDIANKYRDHKRHAMDKRIGKAFAKPLNKDTFVVVRDPKKTGRVLTENQWADEVTSKTSEVSTDKAATKKGAKAASPGRRAQGIQLAKLLLAFSDFLVLLGFLDPTKY